MVKATFFESPIGYLHRCVFAGLDTNDRPQWLMVDQGEEMMTLDYPRIQTETLKNLRRRGIEWKQEKLELGVHVFKYYEKENHADAYRFSIYCNDIGYVMGMDNFNTVKDLMEAVRCFFDALEKGAGIGLRKELRFHDVNLLDEMDDENKKMFDKIV